MVSGILSSTHWQHALSRFPVLWTDRKHSSHNQYIHQTIIASHNQYRDPAIIASPPPLVNIQRSQIGQLWQVPGVTRKIVMIVLSSWTSLSCWEWRPPFFCTAGLVLGKCKGHSVTQKAFDAHLGSVWSPLLWNDCRLAFWTVRALLLCGKWWRWWWCRLFPLLTYYETRKLSKWSFVARCFCAKRFERLVSTRVCIFGLGYWSAMLTTITCSVLGSLHGRWRWRRSGRRRHTHEKRIQTKRGNHFGRRGLCDQGRQRPIKT